MIATIVTFIYISFLCWCYGDFGIGLLERRSNRSFRIGFCITLFCGLATIGALFTIVSLFLPLGTITAQLLLLLPAIAWAISKKSRLFESINITRKKFQAWPVAFKLGFFSSALLILVMHSWTINHPDTLNYHAQNILWIEKYRAVPGLANLLPVYGLQSSWFIVSALFSFQFTGTTALTFVNAVAAVWFVAFVIQRIALSFASNNKNLYGLLWILLLVTAFWSYTQIRLSVTSGSPDFITTLYMWLIVYLFVEYRNAHDQPGGLLLVFLGFFAITIKLQSLPIILLPLYYCLWQNKSKLLYRLLSTGLIGLVVIGPLVIRNAISSGYLLFPSAFPDILNVDWKTKKEWLTITKNFITAYARTRSQFSQSPDANAMKLTEWIPTWWGFKSPVDKAILISLPVLFLSSLLFSRKLVNAKNKTLLTAFVFLLPGLAFWFINAPDLRFGYGFLIPAIGILSCLLLTIPGEKIGAPRKWLSICLLLFTAGILGYTGYRFAYFFERSVLIQPVGIEAVPYTTVDCNGIKMNTPTNYELCAGTPLPCTRIDCNDIVPRGRSIEEGFKNKR